jgi:hypothetical protein
MRTRTVLICFVILCVALAPQILHRLLKPLARRCAYDHFETWEVWTPLRVQYERCEFGLPQPLELLVSMLASGHYAPVLAALALAILMAALCYAIWKAIWSRLRRESDGNSRGS